MFVASNICFAIGAMDSRTKVRIMVVTGFFLSFVLLLASLVSIQGRLPVPGGLAGYA